MCTQSWSHVGSSLVLAGCYRLSLWQAVWLSLRQADSLAFSGCSGSGLSLWQAVWLSLAAG